MIDGKKAFIALGTCVLAKSKKYNDDSARIRPKGEERDYSPKELAGIVLEDLERGEGNDKIGISLTKAAKAIDAGYIWFKEEGREPEEAEVLSLLRGTLFSKGWRIECCDIDFKLRAFPLNEYGKTWALTKKELER